MAENGTGQSSISEYIDDYRELEISYDRIHLKEAVKFTPDSSGITDGIILGETFADKYRSDLENIVETKVFTRDEIFKYKCNPWRLSYDLYNSVEYWHMLLDLNDMVSATEFTRTTIKVYDDTLPDLINEIMMGEEVFIDNNEDEVNEKLGITLGLYNDEDNDNDDDD